ncbi:hypothetical protein GC163_23060 [bacterium]|nr:hypothetical protein [bacterium]
MDSPSLAARMQDDQYFTKLTAYARCQRFLNDPEFASEFIRTETEEDRMMLSTMLAAIGKAEYLKNPKLDEEVVDEPSKIDTPTVPKLQRNTLVWLRSLQFDDLQNVLDHLATGPEGNSHLRAAVGFFLEVVDKTSNDATPSGADTLYLAFQLFSVSHPFSTLNSTNENAFESFRMLLKQGLARVQELYLSMGTSHMVVDSASQAKEG